MEQFKHFIRVLAALEEHQVEYILVGGVAVILHGMERLTRLGEFADYEDLRYECIDYKGLTINIATAETLLWMKNDTVREKDKLDARFLEECLRESKE